MICAGAFCFVYLILCILFLLIFFLLRFVVFIYDFARTNAVCIHVFSFFFFALFFFFFSFFAHTRPVYFSVVESITFLRMIFCVMTTNSKFWPNILCRKQQENIPEKKQDHITMPELVKKLIVPPEQRTNADCKLMADALYMFISSIGAFKEGALNFCTSLIFNISIETCRIS